MSEDEWGVPVMDFSTIIPSNSSFSEDEGCGEDIGNINRGPTKELPSRKPKVIRAKELLRVLRRFHRDHVKHVTNHRNGFLDYHAMNPRLRSSRPAQKTILDGHFDEMGFVYDSVLSEDYGRSCILELVSVEFNARKSGPSPGVKRSLSLDDLDIMAQKNDQLDKRMLMLFGGDDNKQVGLKVLCDGCYNMEKLECQFSRCTTILQDDRVIRKTTFMQDGKESVTQESVSYPRYFLKDSLKMVDEYYSIQYAEGLFKRCKMAEIWKSVDFVHKKWLGEIIDYEYILMSNSLSSIPKRQNSKESVSLYSDGFSRPSTMLITPENENYHSSTGSLNNVLVEGVSMHNDSINNSSISKNFEKANIEDGTTASGPESNSLESNCEDRSTRKLKMNANNLIVKMGRYRVKSKAKNMGLALPNHCQRKILTRKKSSRTLPEKRDRAERNVGADLENDSESSEKTKVWTKDGADSFGAWNSSMIPGVGDDKPSTSGLIVDGYSEVGKTDLRVNLLRKGRKRLCEECSESLSSSSGYVGPNMKPEMTSTRDDELVVTYLRRGKVSKPSKKRSRKRSTKNGLTNYSTSSTGTKLVLRLLSKEVQKALSGEKSPDILNLAECDCYIELQNFCVVFREEQVLRRLRQEKSQPITMAEKILKVIDDCKMACLKICQSSVPDGGNSSEEYYDTPEDDNDDDNNDGDGAGDGNSPLSSTTSSDSSSEGEDKDCGCHSRPDLHDADDDADGSSMTSSTSDHVMANSPLHDVEAQQKTEEIEVEEEEVEEEKQDEEKSGTIQERFTTNTVEEEYREDIGTFFLIHLLKYLWDTEGKHSLCACKDCLEFVQEMHRIIDGTDQPNKSPAWEELQKYFPDDVSTSRHIDWRPSRGAEDAGHEMAVSVDEPTTSGANVDELYRRNQSKSDRNLNEPQSSPLIAVKRFLSNRRLVCFKTRNTRRYCKNSNKGVALRAKKIRANCRKSVSFSSQSSRSFLNKIYHLEV